MTRNDVGLDDRKAAALHAVLAAITLVVIYVSAGLSSALTQLGGYWFTFLVFIIWVGLVFLINLFLSPWQLQKQADAKILELEEKIGDRERRQLVLNKLWRLRSDGIALRNKPITTEAEFVDWQRRYEEWRENILRTAEERSVDLREWLDRLERMGAPPSGLTFYFDDTGESEHRRLVGIMTEMLVRLQKHLEKDLK